MAIDSDEARQFAEQRWTSMTHAVNAQFIVPEGDFELMGPLAAFTPDWYRQAQKLRACEYCGRGQTYQTISGNRECAGCGAPR
jgi:hypothetical protein